MSSLNNISLIGKRVGVWYAKQGIIKTNFGYMHKDWISEAFKRNFIAGTDPSQYRLVINYSMQSKTNKRVGRDWDSEQVLTSQLDMVDNPRKPGYKTMRFFKWLEDKREVFRQINQEDIKKMSDFIKNIGINKKELIEKYENV